jgi:hypothetical protein
LQSRLKKDHSYRENESRYRSGDVGNAERTKVESDNDANDDENGPEREDVPKRPGARRKRARRKDWLGK